MQTRTSYGRGWLDLTRPSEWNAQREATRTSLKGIRCCTTDEARVYLFRVKAEGIVIRYEEELWMSSAWSGVGTVLWSGNTPYCVEQLGVDPRCKPPIEEFCERYPDHEDCVAVGPDDPPAVDCEANPDHEDCVAVGPDDPPAVDCEANPDNPLCTPGEYCADNPDDVNCKGIIEEICEANPADYACVGPDPPVPPDPPYCSDHMGSDARCGPRVTEFCEANPTHATCVTVPTPPGGTSGDYCRSNPWDALCREIVDAICAADPSDFACVGPESGVDADNPGGDEAGPEAIWLTGTFKSIAVGHIHACGIYDGGVLDGAVYCWGRGDAGQREPVAGGGHLALAAGQEHSCAMGGSGLVQCWGGNAGGQTAVPIGATYKAVSAGGDLTCGLDPLGEPECWGGGSDADAFVPLEETVYEQLDVGYNHICALLEGTGPRKPDCWGTARSLVLSTPVLNRVSQISAGAGHSCGIGNFGKALCWGGNEYGQLDDVPGWAGVDEVSAGAYHSCLVHEGNAFCWGDNRFGQSGRVDGPEEDGFVEVVAGGELSCARTGSGRVRCWGDLGELGIDLLLCDSQTTVVCVAPEDLPECKGDVVVNCRLVPVPPGPDCGVVPVPDGCPAVEGEPADEPVGPEEEDVTGDSGPWTPPGGGVPQLGVPVAEAAAPGSAGSRCDKEFPGLREQVETEIAAWNQERVRNRGRETTLYRPERYEEVCARLVLGQSVQSFGNRAVWLAAGLAMLSLLFVGGYWIHLGGNGGDVSKARGLALKIVAVVVVMGVIVGIWQSVMYYVFGVTYFGSREFTGGMGAIGIGGFLP